MSEEQMFNDETVTETETMATESSNGNEIHENANEENGDCSNHNTSGSSVSNNETECQSENNNEAAGTGVASQNDQNNESVNKENGSVAENGNVSNGHSKKKSTNGNSNKSTPVISDKQPEHFRKVFVGSLNYSTTEDSLRDHFCKYGELVDCVIMKESKTGKSRGFGFVTYSDISMVDEMMKNRPHKLDGRELETKRATPREEVGKPGAEMTTKKLFVGALKEGMTEEHLREYFCKYGKIDDCIVMKEKESNKSRGFGFVTFDDYDPVDKVVLEKTHVINNQNVAVKKALPKEQTVSGRNSLNANNHGSRGNYNNHNGNGHNHHNSSNNGHHHHHQNHHGHNNNVNNGHHHHHQNGSNGRFNNNQGYNNNNNGNMNGRLNGNYNNKNDRFNDNYNDDFNSNNFNDRNGGFNSFSNNSGNGFNPNAMPNNGANGNGMPMDQFTNFALMAQKMLQAANMAGAGPGSNGFASAPFPGPMNGGGGNAGNFSQPNQVGADRNQQSRRGGVGFDHKNGPGGGPIRSGGPMPANNKRSAPYGVGRKSK